MKNIFMILPIVMIIGAADYQSVAAEPSQMVQRHIFAPDDGVDQKSNAPGPNPVDAAGLEKELTFTGVIVTPKGKQVLLSETGKSEKGAKKQKHILKEGESVKGMTIKEIGSNYVVLSSNENLVRMKLYTGIKTRPTAPAPTALAEAGTATNPAGDAKPPMMPQNPPPGVDPSATDPSKSDSRRNPPTPDNIGTAAEGGIDNSGQQQPPQQTANPFSSILKRANENASPGRTGGNPFTGK